MNRFTNVNIKKEYKRLVRNLVISIIIVLLGIGFKFWEKQIVDESNKNKKDLHSVIIDTTPNQDYKASYVDIVTSPYKFAIYDDTTDAYYFVSDGKYLYVVYMSATDFEKLDKDDYDGKSIRIEGVTKNITDDIKEIAIEVYNDNVEEDEQIQDYQFENYFGSIYLDMTESESSVAGFQWFMFFALIISGGIALIINLSKLLKFNKKIKKLDGTKIDELDNEMNNKDAFYYSKIHLYLTDNYIINFDGYFNFIKYEDVLWMYRYEVRTNGIKSSQSIKVLARDGITYLIATIDVYSKKKKEIYEEIWNTIYSKNPNMRLGYTSENISDMNEKIKEIKKNK